MITLAILNYNGADTLRASIESVLRQTLKPDRFVVIDNSSTDNSRQIAVKMGVEVIDADNRYQFITGLNKAMELNRDILFFMQNDVVLDEDCLRTMYDNYPYRYLFFAQPVIYDARGDIDNCGMDYHWPGFGERRSKKFWNGFEKYIDCGLVTTICFMTNANNLFWDPLFRPAYYEDLDMYLRTKKSYRHVLVPDAKCSHLGNHTFSQSYKKKEISGICRKNRKLLICKHYNGLDRMLRLMAVNVIDSLLLLFSILV